MIKKWFKSRRRNFQLLRDIANQIGKEYERMPYDVLADPSQPISCEREVEGLLVSWTADVIRKKENGDIDFNIDFYAALPTLLGIKPAYRFWKRRDESIYY